MAWSGRAGLTLLTAAAFLQITLVSSQLEVPLLPRKCCPKNQFLNVTSSSCVVLSDTEESPLEILHRSSSIPIGFPETCEDYNIVPVSSSKSYDYGNICVDKTIDFNVVTVSCLQTGSDRQNINVINFRKCCPLGFAYNRTEHMCREYHKYDIVQQFRKNLNNSYVNFKYGLKACVSDKAVMSYILKDSSYSIDLNGVLRISYGDFPEGLFCVDFGVDDDVIARVCKNDVEELCENNVCIRKCCPEGHTYQRVKNKSRCRPSDLGFVPHLQHLAEDTGVLEDVAYTGNAAIISNFSCPGGRYRLDVERYPETDAHYLSSNGDLHFLVDDSREQELQSVFCIENVENIKNETGQNTFVCFPAKSIEEKFKWYRVAYLISCLFFVLTFSVYCCLPDLQNLYGKTLMCYVLSLLFAYICVTTAQFVDFEFIWCKIIGFLIIFTFFAAFCWLNIMCFDIWCTFGGTQNVKGLHMEKKDLKRFLLYGLYGWGVPCLLTLNMILIDNTNILPDILKPFVGKYRCLYAKKDFYGGLIFFLGPIIVQSVCNLVLFVMTAYHCSRVKAEIHRLQMGSQGERRKSRFLADKAKFMMNMKLFLVMGISWIHEVFSILFPEPAWLWYPGDFFNMLLGIPIFCIFVLKPKVWQLLLQRAGIKKKMGTRTSSSTPSSSIPKNKKFSMTSSTFTSPIITNQKSLN